MPKRPRGTCRASPSVDDLVALHDPDGRFVQVSPSSRTILGYDPDELVGIHPVQLTHPADRDQLRAMQAAVGAGRACQVGYRMRAKNGEYIWLETRVLPGPASGAPGQWQATSRPVPEPDEVAIQLDHFLQRDPLTGLPNRERFAAILRCCLNQVPPGVSCAVLVIDIDHFCHLHHGLGYAEGDRVLVEVAERLVRCLPPGHVAARLDGDRFAVMRLSGTEMQDLTALAQMIMVACSPPIRIGEYEFGLTVSVGIARGESGDGPEAILHNAETALTWLKHHGRTPGYQVFDATLTAQLSERLRLAGQLQRAHERGELRLHYQPVVCLQTGRMAGIEALVRWEHPQRGLIMPGEFVPLAEETGLIHQLGEWVLETACRDLSNMQHSRGSARPALFLSVNLSTRQLRRPALVETVAGILRNTGVAPQCLQLEITESAMIEDEETTINVLLRLKKLGVRLAIDDFGVGYSSLRYLRQMPVDVLKIDRSFIAGLDADPKSTVIVQTVVAAARRLKLTAIAEGVEHPGQVALLRTFHCELAQGYHLARPVPMDQLEALFDRPLC